MSDMLIGLAREALAIEEDIQYRVNNPHNPRLFYDGFDMIIFDQTWGSTALGFGGIGGDAMTQARTYVFIPMVDGEDCIVYFAGRFAYKAPYSSVFAEDVRRQMMEPVYRAGKYIKAAKGEGRENG